jgi:hypothetical protein
MKLSIVVCRDCCCGNLRKHPEFDHDAQLAEIRAAMEGRGKVRTSTCLDACEHSNVVVISERHGLKQKNTWLAGILGPELTRLLADWLRAGGPLPDALARLRFSPRLRSRSRRIRPR